MGPCFNSPPGKPSEWIYVISFNFKEASKAASKSYPRPKKNALGWWAISSAIALISILESIKLFIALMTSNRSETTSVLPIKDALKIANKAT